MPGVGGNGFDRRNLPARRHLGGGEPNHFTQGGDHHAPSSAPRGTWFARRLQYALLQRLDVRLGPGQARAGESVINLSSGTLGRGWDGFGTGLGRVESANHPNFKGLGRWDGLQGGKGDYLVPGAGTV